MRAGTLTLLMVANTTKRHILRELLGGPKGLDELCDERGEPAEIGLDDSGTVRAKLTKAGHEMLYVGFVLERWLHASPVGPLELGSQRANEAVAALVCGWSSTTVHALAAEPLAFAALNRCVETLSFSLLEEHVDAMERDRQLEARESAAGPIRYAATEWLREAVAPLCAAARLERRASTPDTAPIDRLDVEAAFHLALPLVRLPESLSGTARLTTTLENGDERPVQVIAEVERGRVGVRGVAEPDDPDEELPEGDAWASGSALEWLDAVIEGNVDGMTVGGDPELGAALLGGLHQRLFGVPVGA